VDPRTQVDAARQRVLALPHTELATLIVTGADRLSWLNGMLTCDLAKRTPGDVVYGLAVARNGRVISDAIVVVDDAAATVLVAVPRAVAPALRAHLDHYLVMEDAEIGSATDAFDAWALHGPAAADLLADARSAGAAGGAIDRTGLGGAFLLAPARKAAQTTAVIERSVAMRGGAIGDEAGWEALRLERGVPRFGVDFDDKTYPQEASLEKTAVRFDKGCYLGQEVVCMLELRGHVKRKLVPLVLDASRPLERGAAVTDDAGVSVGEVTSAALSPTLGKTVALAYVKRAYAQAGKRVLVGGVGAQVVGMPA
jgi:folate-binding protein YgfZ